MKDYLFGLPVKVCVHAKHRDISDFLPPVSQVSNFYMKTIEEVHVCMKCKDDFTAELLNNTYVPPSKR